jgi:hypothetical protein
MIRTISGILRTVHEMNYPMNQFFIMYPLVNVYITNWKITMLGKSTNFQWQCSIADLVGGFNHFCFSM